MLDMHIFRNGRFVGAVSGVVPITLGATGALFLLTQHLQFVHGYPAWETGLRPPRRCGAAALAVMTGEPAGERYGRRRTRRADLVRAAGPRRTVQKVRLTRFAESPTTIAQT